MCLFNMTTDRHHPELHKDNSTGHHCSGKAKQNTETLQKPKSQQKVKNLQKTKTLQKPIHQEKKKNVSNILTDRTLRQLLDVQSQCDYHAPKISDRSLREELDLNFTSRCPITSVNYVKGGFKSVLGLWNSVDSRHTYAIGELPLMSSDRESSLGFTSVKKYVEDICQVIHDTILYIHHDSEGYSNIELVWKDESARNGTSTCSHFHSGRNKLFCCTSTYIDYHHLAIGGHNCMTFYDGISPVRSYKVDGDIKTVSFDTIGDRIFAGRSDGYVYIYDTRNKGELCACFKPDQGDSLDIVDSKFISDEKIVLTGLSNELYTIDLRNFQSVATFEGHTHSSKKSAMSTSNDLLCVNGADNVIRIWTLGGGPPIYEIHPTSPEIEIRGWLQSEANKTLLYYFEGLKKQVFEI